MLSHMLSIYRLGHNSYKIFSLSPSASYLAVITVFTHSIKKKYEGG